MTGATMRAAVIAQPGRVRIGTCARPEPGAGEVRVRLDGCGVCGSNGPVWEGRPWFEYPLDAGSPGHEGWGRVDAVGPGVEHLRIGDRVAGLSYHAFAEHDVARASELVRVPDELATLPLPAEPLGCAMNVFLRSGIGSGDDVAVLGIGFLGALVTSLAARAGARVVALSRRGYARDVARACGAADTIGLDADDALGRALAGTGGRGFDVVVECVGTQRVLDLAGPLTRERGRLVIAGYHQDGRRTVDMQLWNWRGLDVINAHEREAAVHVEGMRRALEEVRAGRLAIEELVTHRFTLDDVGVALETMRARPDGFLKGVVVP